MLYFFRSKPHLLSLRSFWHWMYRQTAVLFPFFSPLPFNGCHPEWHWSKTWGICPTDQPVFCCWMHWLWRFVLEVTATMDVVWLIWRESIFVPGVRGRETQWALRRSVQGFSRCKGHRTGSENLSPVSALISSFFSRWGWRCPNYWPDPEDGGGGGCSGLRRFGRGGGAGCGWEAWAVGLSWTPWKGEGASPPQPPTIRDPCSPPNTPAVRTSILEPRGVLTARVHHSVHCAWGRVGGGQ